MLGPYRGKNIFKKSLEYIYNLKKSEGKSYFAGFVDLHDPIAMSVQKGFTNKFLFLWLMKLPFNKKIILGPKIGHGKQAE